MKEFYQKLKSFDYVSIAWARRVAVPLARFAIFLVYFWFGLLKVLQMSPASPLVLALLDKTMPFINPDSFLIAFGVIEMVIGLLFIIPKLERLAIFALVLHLITTIMPLFLLPEYAWQGFLTPTLEGQYMIKNILIIACGIFVLSSLKPYKEENLNA
jgi:uncharacterized membrane protein YkgB